MAEISSLPGQSGQNCEGDDEPGHSIIDNKTLSLAQSNILVEVSVILN